MTSIAGIPIAEIIGDYLDDLSCYSCGISVRDIGYDENRCLCGISYNKFDVIDRIKTKLLERYCPNGEDYKELVASFIFGLHMQKSFGVIVLHSISESEEVAAKIFERYVAISSRGM